MLDEIQELDALYTIFCAEWGNAQRGNKTAGSRARKKALEIEKMLKAMRKSSLNNHR